MYWYFLQKIETILLCLQPYIIFNKIVFYFHLWLVVHWTVNYGGEGGQRIDWGVSIQLDLSAEDEHADLVDIILEGQISVTLLCCVAAENTTALRMSSTGKLTSISTSSGLYLCNVPLHSSCDSYKGKCHNATLKVVFKNAFSL